jgi:hypothetical protein
MYEHWFTALAIIALITGLVAWLERRTRARQPSAEGADQRGRIRSA